MKSFLFLTGLMSMLCNFHSAVSSASSLTNPVVSQATCPTTLVESPTPPGAPGAGVQLCIGEKPVSFDSPEVTALKKTAGWATEYKQAVTQAASLNQPLKETAATIIWSGVTESIAIDFVTVSEDGKAFDFNPLGRIIGTILLDASGNEVVVDVESTIGTVPPGGASVGNF